MDQCRVRRRFPEIDLLKGWSHDATTNELSGTLEDRNPPPELVVVLTATVPSSAKAAAIAFPLTITLVNNAPEFVSEAQDQTAKEGEFISFQAPIAKDPDHEEEELVYSAFVVRGDSQEVELVPGDDFWLDFDPATRTFSGTPGRDEAPRTH